MAENTQTQQKQKKLLHECGFSKLKASRTKNGFPHIGYLASSTLVNGVQQTRKGNSTFL